MLRPILAAVALTWAFDGAALAEDAPWENWQSALHADTEHARTLWDTRAGEATSPQEMIDRLAGARFVLLGEVHDNPDHHRLQGWIISELASRGERPAVVMEMIPQDKADVLAEYLAQPGATAEGLGPALDWAESGWPDWAAYQPIAEATFGAGLAISAGNPSGDLTRKAARQGLDALGPRKADLALDAPLSPALGEALSDELYDGHCEMVPRERLAPMGNVQRLRDAVMADALLAHDQAVLIAGNGHVRADRGVPWYLRRRVPESRVAVVMAVELEDADKTPGDYVERGPDGAPVADFVWLTPRAERPDPCEQMRQHLQNRSGN